jgi:hypothetical protein
MTQGRCGERIFEGSLLIAPSDISEGVDGWYISTVTETLHFGNDTPAPTFRPPRSSPSLSPLPNNILPATPSSKRCVTYPAAARKIFQT